MSFNKVLNLLSLILISSVVQAAPYQAFLEIDTKKPGATIHRNIYGQFAEHLGRGIYEGVWVGENSNIANTNGFRDDVIEALKAIKVPLVRWPGGCFADEYHWRDGIGPREKRPVRVNTHWGGVEESNAFGTHEFFELVEMLGAEAYVSGNLGSGSVQEMAEWVEYITSDSNSSLAQLRKKNGREKPWSLHYFGIGNESWGCGGHMRPEYYSDLYLHYSTFLKTAQDTKFIGSGGYPDGDDATRWTQVLSDRITRKMNAISFHYYTLPSGNWDKKGRALAFAEREWFDALAQTLKMKGFIAENIKVLEDNDPDKKLGFYVDEWGTWYDPEPGDNPGFLYQQNTLRDAIIAALNFNIFHQFADRVQMTNIAQMVNVLQAMILTDKEKMLVTPTYHAFGMYSVFQDATFLPVNLRIDKTYQLGEKSLPAISATAARAKDGKVYLALVNLDPKTPAQIKTTLLGDKITQLRGQLLTAPSMDAHNSFEKPQQVRPSEFKTRGKSYNSILLPPKSILVVSVN